MTNEVDLVLARLPREEGVEKFAYNDATGKRVTCKPSGNLSIGEGINLEEGLYPEEIDWLTRNRIQRAGVELIKLSWYAALDFVRRSVILDVAFNDGVAALLAFHRMITALEDKNFPAAKAQLLDSAAARELPSRYGPLADILGSGIIPAPLPSKTA